MGKWWGSEKYNIHGIKYKIVSCSMYRVSYKKCMRLTLTQLMHLSVETVSGTKLGRVYDVVLETEGQLIAQYLVRRLRLGGALYRISRDQVVRFEEHRLIVDDGVVKEKMRDESFVGKKRVSVEPVAMREE